MKTSDRLFEKIKEVRNQIQKDLVDYLEASWWPPHIHDRVCEIVEENFKKLLPPEEE